MSSYSELDLEPGGQRAVESQRESTNASSCLPYKSPNCLLPVHHSQSFIELELVIDPNRSNHRLLVSLSLSQSSLEMSSPVIASGSGAGSPASTLAQNSSVVARHPLCPSEEDSESWGVEPYLALGATVLWEVINTQFPTIGASTNLVHFVKADPKGRAMALFLRYLRIPAPLNQVANIILWKQDVKHYSLRKLDGNLNPPLPPGVTAPSSWVEELKAFVPRVQSTVVKDSLTVPSPSSSRHSSPVRRSSSSRKHDKRSRKDRSRTSPKVLPSSSSDSPIDHERSDPNDELKSHSEESSSESSESDRTPKQKKKKKKVETPKTPSHTQSVSSSAPQHFPSSSNFGMTSFGLASSSQPPLVQSSFVPVPGFNFPMPAIITSSNSMSQPQQPVSSVSNAALLSYFCPMSGCLHRSPSPSSCPFHGKGLVLFTEIPIGKSFPRLFHQDPSLPYFDSSLVSYSPMILSTRISQDFIPLHLFCNEVVRAFQTASPPIPEDRWLNSLPPGLVPVYDSMNTHLANSSNNPAARIPFDPAAFLPKKLLCTALLGLCLHRVAPATLFMDTVAAAVQLLLSCEQLPDNNYGELVHQFELIRRYHHDYAQRFGPWIADYDDFDNEPLARARAQIAHAAARANTAHQTLTRLMAPPLLVRSSAAPSTPGSSSKPSAPSGFCNNYWNHEACTKVCKLKNESGEVIGPCRFKWLRSSEIALVNSTTQHNPDWPPARKQPPLSAEAKAARKASQQSRGASSSSFNSASAQSLAPANSNSQ